MANKPMQVQIQVVGAGGAAANLRQVASALRQVNQAQQQGGGSAYVNIYNYGRGGARNPGGRGGSTLGSRVLGAINSTRINLGGASPLIGRVAGLAGAGPGGQAFGLALTSGALAVGAFASVVRGVAENIGNYGRALTVSGAGPGQLARLSALGLGPGDAASGANQYRSALASDPMAQLARSKLGLGFMGPQQLGGQDNAKGLAEALEALRKITNAEEQLRLARMSHLEGYLDEIRVSEQTYQARKRDAELREQVMGNPKTVQAARDYNSELKRTGELWGDVVGQFGAEILPDALLMVRQLNQTLHDAMPVAKAFGDQVHNVFEDLIVYAAGLAALLNGMDPQLAMAGARAGLQAAAAMQQSAAAQQVQAAQTFANAVNQGINGGGARARGALPSRFAALLQGASAGSKSEFDALLNGRSVSLGAFTL